MSRPKKLKLKLNQESLTELINESYKELSEQRSTALRQYNKQNIMIKTSTDVPMIGKTNADLLKIIDSSIDKKISLSRLIKDIVMNDDGQETPMGELSLEDKKLISDLVHSEGSNAIKDKVEKDNIQVDYGSLTKDDSETEE